MLTAEDQERYARHLLLGGLGGDGQERLAAGAVRVRGPAALARWTARYLAAAGVGTLTLEGDWAPAAAAECGAQNPGVRVRAGGPKVPGELVIGPPPADVSCGLEGARGWAGEGGLTSPAEAGAKAAQIALRLLSGAALPPRRLLRSLAQAVGDTPLVRLRAFEPPGVEIWAKLEWHNPGGSVKDRAALGILTDALERGLVQAGGPRTLIDSTSGNTGIAYAWLGAALGVPVALVMPENVSAARKQIARAYGARIVFSDPLEQSDGAIRLCRKLVAEEPARWWYADQYSNPHNPFAHERTTAREIWDQTAGRVTHFVAGIGTGGTIMGTGRGLRARNPDVQVIAVEPAEALHGLEGLKHMPSSIVPPIYDERSLSRKLSIDTDAGWDFAERLIAEQGLLAGHSAGAAAAGAAQIARELAAAGRGGVVVTLFPDRADRYLPAAPP